MFDFIIIVGLGGFVAGGLCIAFATKFVVSWWDKDLGKKLEEEKWDKLVIVSGIIGAIVVYMNNYH